MTAEQDSKTCNRCGAEKPLDEFPPKKFRSGNRGWHSRCRACKRVDDLERYHSKKDDPEFRERFRANARRAASKRTKEQRREEKRRLAERRGKPYRPISQLTERQVTRLAEANARQAWKHWLDVLAPDAWVAAYWEAMGEPWRNPRLSEGERYRLRYQQDEPFRHREVARSRIQKGKRRKRVKVANDHTVDEAALLAERKGCPYCGTRLHQDNRCLDHMEPISKGGTHSAANLVACCRRCNARKSATPFVEWVEMLGPRYQRIAKRAYEQKTGAPLEQMGFRWAG